MSDAIIKRIDCFTVRWHMPEPLRNSIGTFEARTALLVRVTTRSGIVGWGETWAAPAASETIIGSVLAPAVLGADASLPLPIWHRMSRLLGRDRSGITHFAISAIDMAIWDVAARLDNVSLAKKLGGALHDRLPTYASGPFMKTGSDPYGDFLPEIENYLERGFTAIKMRLGASRDGDLQALTAIRNTFGADLPLMADFNHGLSVDQAIEIGPSLKELGLLFVEEPLVPDDLEGYSKLAGRSPLTVAAGESWAGLSKFKDFIAAGVTVLQPDAALCGGVTEYVRIAALAQAHSLPVIPHVWSTAVLHCASLQLASLAPPIRAYGPAYPVFEVDPTPNALMEIGEVPKINADGTISVPDLPGIGLDLDEKILAPFIASHRAFEH